MSKILQCVDMNKKCLLQIFGHISRIQLGWRASLPIYTGFLCLYRFNFDICLANVLQ
jgi:hypothetical protein